MSSANLAAFMNLFGLELPWSRALWSTVVNPHSANILALAVILSRFLPQP